MKSLFFLFAFLISISTGMAQGTDAEIKQVRAACMDYINTFYQVDTTLAYRSVHKSVRKVGFHFKDEENEYSDQLEMPFDKLISLAKRWNKNGERTDANSPKEVEIFEVSDKIATAKVTAIWGIDYLSLMKENDKWMIVNVLWQSPPKFSVSGTK